MPVLLPSVSAFKKVSFKIFVDMLHVGNPGLGEGPTVSGNYSLVFASGL